MKILKSGIAFILALTMLLLVSCGETATPDGRPKRDDELTAYGIHFFIPEGFTYSKTTIAEHYYTDGDATCYITQYDAEQLEEMEVDPDITVYNYTRMFMGWNNIPMNSYNYDEARNVGTVEIVSDFGAGAETGLPAEYFRFQIMRNSTFLYVATASCPDGEQEAYKATFDEWFDYIYIE